MSYRTASRFCMMIFGPKAIEGDSRETSHDLACGSGKSNIQACMWEHGIKTSPSPTMNTLRYVGSMG